MKINYSIASVALTTLMLLSCDGSGSSGGSTGGGGYGGDGDGWPVVPTPNGALPHFIYSWHFDAIGYDAVQSKNLTGKGVLVAVVDTGIDVDHPYLAHLIDENSTRFFYGEQYSDIEDSLGHGTTMASLIAGGNYDNGVLIGLAPEARLLVVGADDYNGYFEVEDLGLAIDYAVEHDAQIINLSLGSPDGGYGDADIIAIRNAAQNDVIVFVSTGNDGPDGPVSFTAVQAGKAQYNGLLVAVTAIDEDGDAAYFASPCDVYDPSFCLAAPGVNVYEAEDPYYYYYNTGYGDGTSQATAITSGAMAILLQAFPNLSPQEAVQILLQSADDLGEPGPDRIYGAGRLNLEAALAPQGALAFQNSTTLSQEDRVVQNANIAGASLSKAASLSQVAVLDEFERRYWIDMRRGVFSRHDRLDLKEDETRLNAHLRYQDIKFRGLDSVDLRYGDLARGQSENTSLYYVNDQLNANPYGDLLDLRLGLGSSFEGFGLVAEFATNTDKDIDREYGQFFATRAIGALEIGLGYSQFEEQGAFLGSEFKGAYGEIEHASTKSVHFGAGWQGSSYDAFLRGSMGSSNVTFKDDQGLFIDIEDAKSSSFAAGLGFRNLLLENDRLDVAVSQNLRLDEGDLIVNPDILENERIDLSAKGRELSYELGYFVPISENFSISTNFVYQTQPHHEKKSDAQTAFAFRAEYSF